ncbi:UPF0280 family protein [Rhodospirillum sp. A1_3_36]|uniref:UPF0280 family protein n=1 Tax=Rhodospirillum sp. A1_3_36 TaxID=3391666 RepID=UPI0039A53A86
MSHLAGSEVPLAFPLADQRRLCLRYGPIELVIEAEGPVPEVRKAYAQARAAFDTVLSDLIEDLPRLRAEEGPLPKGAIARRMVAVTAPYRPTFITPMAAVAGAVADHILARLVDGRQLARAYVNNGGDIALFLREGAFRVGICDNPETGEAGGIVEITPEDGIGGIATSGWRGRSHSLGIADAVTVLAASAAEADAAATLVANAVDVQSVTSVQRVPARDLAPDSDLGDRPVTVAVGPLSQDEVRSALAHGEAAARDYLSKGLFRAAYLALAGERRTIAPQDHLTPLKIPIRKEAIHA